MSFSIYDFINVNIMPQKKSWRLQHLDVVLGKQTIASNQRLLLLPGLAMMTSQVLEFYSIFSAHYQHHTALYWSGPQPSCCWTSWKSDGDPNKARLVQALGNMLFCAYQLLLNTEVKAAPASTSSCSSSLRAGAACNTYIRFNCLLSLSLTARF